MEEAGQRLDLLLAAYHRHLHALATVERVGQRADDPPHGDWRRLPADLARLRLAEDEGAAGSGVGTLAGKDRSWLGHLLQPSGDIDGVAGHDVLVGSGHHLTGVDADANGEADAMLRFEFRIQLRQPLEHLARCPERPLSVILAHDWDAEGGHDRVAHELLDGTTPGLDRRGHDRVEPLKEDSPALGVETLAEAGRPRDVREQDGDELALLHRPVNERRAAGRAEACPSRYCRRTLRACRVRSHDRSLLGHPSLINRRRHGVANKPRQKPQ